MAHSLGVGVAELAFQGHISIGIDEVLELEELIGGEKGAVLQGGGAALEELVDAFVVARDGLQVDGLYVFDGDDEGARGEDIAEGDEDGASLVAFARFEDAFGSGERAVDDADMVALLHLTVEGEIFYSVVEYLYDVAEIVELVVGNGHGGVGGVSDEAYVCGEEVVAAYGEDVCLGGF